MQQMGECKNSTSYTGLVNRKSHVPLYDTLMTPEFPTTLHGVLSVLKTKDINHIECRNLHVCIRCECDSYI